jgi:hypothetical protein
MAYEQIEQISARKGEKVAAFLTIENAAGLIVTALPAYLLSGGLPFLLRAIVLVAAAALGVLATLEIGGLALYERLLWRGRGVLRTRFRGRRLTPEQFVGALRTLRQDRPLRLAGPVQIATPDRALPGDIRGRASKAARPPVGTTMVPRLVGGQFNGPAAPPVEGEQGVE